MKYKLFISDFDGTLGSAPSHIEEQTVKAIKEYEKRGGRFVICTGRSYPSIKMVCDKYGLGGLIVAFQGAYIVESDTNTKILDAGMTKEQTIAVVKDLLDEGVETGVYMDNLMYYEWKAEGLSEYEKLCGAKGKQVDNLIEFVKNSPLQVRKVLSVIEPTRKKIIMEKLSKKYEGELIVNSSSAYFLEIINPKYNKGFGVKKIAEYYNIPLSEVITVGDSLNDLELVSGEWHGVIVGDGMEEVKPYAKEITVPFKDQPIKTLLEKYCLD